jgi:hypothetical protein
VYYIRLQYDGWHLVAHDQGPEGRTVFEKSLPYGWTLEKTAHETVDHPVGRGCYYDTHRLKKGDSRETLNFPDWVWADLDRRRLVWVRDGILHAAQLAAQGLREETALFDFNPLTFEERKAPY